ncbi:MAG: RNA-binding protein [Holophagales bacterium]|jgi:RNA recognition motif-containing protein|nr:RNA-binding protein [Holophagales bacterium]MBK9964203.1 RNA-binding protein [Holophagales bacterium]
MKLYVGNLPYAVDDSRLRELFGAFGAPLSAIVVMDRASGRSMGYGFVEMSEEDARRAVAALNRSELEGRTIWVNEARAKG